MTQLGEHVSLADKDLVERQWLGWGAKTQKAEAWKAGPHEKKP